MRTPWPVNAALRRLLSSDIGRHTSIVFAALIVLNASTYVFYALAGRVLGISEYGVFMSLVSLVLLVTAPAMVAQNALSKLVADVAASGDADAVAGLSRATQRLAFGLAGGVFVAAVLLREPLGRLVHAADPLLVPLAAAGAAFVIVVPFQRGVFQGAGRFGELAVSMLVEAVTRIVAVVPLARVAGARGALGALALSLAVPMLTSWLRARALWPHAGRRAPDLKGPVIAALKTGAGFLALTAMLYFDVILVRHYLPPFEAGLYSAVSLVGRAIYTAVAFIPMIVIPKLVARRAAGAATRPVALLAVGAMAAAALGAIGIVAVAPERVIAAVGGAAFRPGAPYLLPYAVAVSALAGANVAVAVRVGLHRFAHVAPLVAIAAGEIGWVWLHHGRIGDVLWGIVVGHCTALGATLAIAAVRRGPVPGQESEPATLTVPLRNE